MIKTSDLEPLSDGPIVFKKLLVGHIYIKKLCFENRTGPCSKWLQSITNLVLGHCVFRPLDQKNFLERRL